MSVQIMSVVWNREDIPLVQKMVLLKLADNANDEGVCWPTVKKLATKCAVKQRAVQYALTWLEERNFLHREMCAGKVTRYIITPESGNVTCADSTPRASKATLSNTSAPDAPVHQMHHAPDASCTNVQETHAYYDTGPMHITTIPHTPYKDKPSLEPSREPSGSDRARRGTCLPTDWTLPGDWFDVAVVKGATPDRILAEAEKFANYWWSTAGPKARKADWRATWCNWIIRSLEGHAHVAEYPSSRRRQAKQSAHQRGAGIWADAAFQRDNHAGGEAVAADPVAAGASLDPGPR